MHIHDKPPVPGAQGERVLTTESPVKITKFWVSGVRRQTVRLKKGQPLLLVFKVNPDAGYTWRLKSNVPAHVHKETVHDPEHRPGGSQETTTYSWSPESLAAAGRFKVSAGLGKQVEGKSALEAIAGYENFLIIVE